MNKQLIAERFTKAIATYPQEATSPKTFAASRLKRKMPKN